MGLSNQHKLLFINTLHNFDGTFGTNGTVFNSFFTVSLFFHILSPFFESHFVPISLFLSLFVPFCSILVSFCFIFFINSMTVNMTVKLKSKLLFNSNLIYNFTKMTEMKAIFSKNQNNLLINQYLKIKIYKKNCQNCQLLTARLSNINIVKFVKIFIINFQLAICIDTVSPIHNFIYHI